DRQAHQVFVDSLSHPTSRSRRGLAAEALDTSDERAPAPHRQIWSMRLRNVLSERRANKMAI
ncbi:MAG TPA: hypothetical protein VF210_12200, partial [Pseudomonadales bacterium]